MTEDILAGFQPPKGLEQVTNSVFADEPCYMLREENRLNQAGDTLCRYQVLRVVRKDSLVNAYVYMGESEDFKADQFQIPGGGVDENGRGWCVHTVAELQEIANFFRAEPVRRELEPLDLDMGFKNHVEERIKKQNHHSTFGHSGWLVRN